MILIAVTSESTHQDSHSLLQLCLIFITIKILQFAKFFALFYCDSWLHKSYYQWFYCYTFSHFHQFQDPGSES